MESFFLKQADKVRPSKLVSAKTKKQNQMNDVQQIFMACFHISFILLFTLNAPPYPPNSHIYMLCILW